MALSLVAWGLLLAPLTLQLGAADGSLPLLCNLCVCIVSKDPPGVDVDCTDKILTYEILYNSTNWIDEKNAPYPIRTLNLKASDLGDLRKQFPASGLTTLDLSDNFVRTVDGSYFAQLQNMTELILSRNEIDRLKPEAFKGLRMDGGDYPLRSLTTLRLDKNRLHTLDQDLFEHVEEGLQLLDLSYNPFKVLDQQTSIAIGSLVYLKELRLGFTDIKQLPEHFLHTPKYLKVLDISGNNFGSVPQTLNDSHVLEVLYFNNNPIVNLTKDNGFPTISTLKVLHMCDMVELEAIEAKSMSNLPILEELYVSNNIKLSRIDPGALTRVEVESEIWPPLKKLHLYNNKLATIDMHLVLHWEKLVELDLRYNPWTCECENQWIVEGLMPVYLKINDTLAKELRCEAPIEMQGLTFYEEFSGNKSMRCLDAYGNRPERDATILVGILIGLLIMIPLVLFVIFAYQRHWFGLFDSSPAAYSRQFYSRTRADEL